MLKTKLKEERDEERRAKQTQEVEKPRANSGVSPPAGHEWSLQLYAAHNVHQLET